MKSDSIAIITLWSKSHIFRHLAYKVQQIASNTSESAIILSLIWHKVVMLPGVSPNIFFVSFPTSLTLIDVAHISTMIALLSTIPLSLTNTKVFAVQRSITISLDKNPSRLPKKVLTKLLILNTIGRTRSQLVIVNFLARKLKCNCKNIQSFLIGGLLFDIILTFMLLILSFP
jgi:hypothetical protein